MQEYIVGTIFGKELERFGVDDQHLNMDQVSTPLLPLLMIVQGLSRQHRSLCSQHGVIFVCNIKSRSSSLALRRLITKSLRKKRKPIRTFTKTMSSLQKRCEPILVNQALTKEAKELFENIGEDLMIFIACPKRSRTAN